MARVSGRPVPYLVALEQCGVELGAPHLLTTTKRRIETADVDVATIADDSLRFTGWAPEAIEARFPGLTPSASYELEAVYLCERDVDRVQSMTSRGLELHRPIELARGTATIVRFAVPPETFADGTLELRVERVRGPDVVMSELRLFSSEPPPPILTAVGDSRGGLIASVATPDSRGVPGTAVRVRGDAGAFELTTDRSGLVRVPLDGLPRGREGTVRIASGDGGRAVELAVDTRHVARGLRELPPLPDRLDLSGEWGYRGGPFRGHRPSDAAAGTARVPGHIIYDGLVPDGGVGTLHRTFELPDAWAGRAVFLRCDGAYGRADVYVNDTLAAVHWSGATSFDVDLTPFVRPGENELAIALTEFTPHAVLDDMSWYAHMSLLGIWRDVLLFATPMLQLAQLDLDADWDPGAVSGTLTVRAEAINLDREERPYLLDVTVRDGDGGVVHRSSRRGTVGAGASAHDVIASEPLGVVPWSAEEPRLYDLEVSLGADGGTRQTVHRRIGFRRVEVRGDQLLVNGAPIRIRGVNRHDSRILKGRALSAEDMRADVINLRRANVNVIRTSHYPPSPHLLDACDEIGMFVFEQPPICFSGGFDDHHWTRTNEAAQLIPYVLEVTAETVQRDRGRCSVIVWDLANESRWGAAFDAQLALVRSMDPTRPTIFSFDLNELGDENELVRKPAAERPEIRSYHYPGWDRTWREDLEWLGSYEQPVVLDEYAPVFAPCLRGPGEGYGLAIDPGIRDYWGAGYQRFVEAALADHGVIGGLIWGGFGEVFAIPLDLTIGQGPWAHLPAADYVRTRDQYPAEPGVFRRGDGDWGLFDAWNRPRPELWHVHQMYSPIAVAAADFDASGDRLELDLRNRFAHRSLAGLDVRVSGGRADGSPALVARPGEAARMIVRRDGEAPVVRLEVWHPEGWLVDGWAWPWPGAPTKPEAAVLDRALPIELDLSEPGSLSIVATADAGCRDGRSSTSLTPTCPTCPSCGLTDGGEVVEIGSRHRPGSAGKTGLGGVDRRASRRPGPRAGVRLHVRRHPPVQRQGGWSDAASFTRAGGPVVASRRGVEPLPVRSHRPDGRLRLRSPRLERDAEPRADLGTGRDWGGEQRLPERQAGDRRRGATDGRRSLTVLSSGRQHLRAELVDGSPCCTCSTGTAASGPSRATTRSGRRTSGRGRRSPAAPACGSRGARRGRSTRHDGPATPPTRRPGRDRRPGHATATRRTRGA